jgi:hypothetical protein
MPSRYWIAIPRLCLVYPKTVMVDEAGNETGRFEDSLHLRDDRPSNRFIRLYNTITLCRRTSGSSGARSWHVPG